MKINGFSIQKAIREVTEDRDLADSRFEGSLKAFPDEDKSKPTDLADEIEKAERRIAALQTAQTRYNLAVTVEVEGRRMPLQEAVKLLGGAKRVESKWRDAAKEEADRYNDTRDKDAIVRARQVSTRECASLAKAAARRVRAIQYAIQTGNATEVDLDLQSDLLL